VDVLLVPPDGPRTKPKACNYALQFARGGYVVVYDAEDLPEPDQLKKALAVFRRSGSRLACVQARLNYHNWSQNWLTGWFTLEYTAWFDLFLPGLVAMGLPIPLGGTSNHFPVSLLRELGTWDSFNVTEDADLGMRLHRAGYRTAVVDSTTWEEANSRLLNWIRQRSRWGKGYAVTWLVHMRHPLRLRHEMGWRGFVALQLLLGASFGSSMLNLALWAVMVLWALTRAGLIASLFPVTVYYLAMVEAIVGNFFFLYVNLYCAHRRQVFTLSHLALLSPLYWLLGGVAMLKAVAQLIRRPAYWEKTVHGLAPALGTHRRPFTPPPMEAHEWVLDPARGSICPAGPTSPRQRLAPSLSHTPALELSDAELRAVTALTCDPMAPPAQLQRARLALLLHLEPSLTVVEVAQRLGQSPSWVYKWRKRWLSAGFTLQDASTTPRQDAPVSHGEG
jgi:hypothetical protein